MTNILNKSLNLLVIEMTKAVEALKQVSSLNLEDYLAYTLDRPYESSTSIASSSVIYNINFEDQGYIKTAHYDKVY
jgi:hypothetical protein